MNPRDLFHPVLKTKADKAKARRARMKGLIDRGYSRSHAFKLAKESLK